MLEVMNRSLQRILDESLSMWKRVQENDSSEAQERSIPTEDIWSARRENETEKVEEGPSPSPEEQCVQNAADAHQPAPP